MSDLKFFSDELVIKDKRIILRLDFNVPMKASVIQDDTRIKIVEPFLSKLVQKKAKLILLSHLGRPNGKFDKNLSLRPVFEFLKKKYKYNIKFNNKKINNDTINETNALSPGEILFLENIRFFKDEENDSEEFAKTLAKLGDIFINEAFSCSHRKQASLHKITKFIDSYGGPLLKKEIQSINLILSNKERPVSCIIGGSKVSTKINVILNLTKKIDNLIIVGAMANNFLKFDGQEIGKSLIEKGSEKYVKKIYELAIKHNCKVYKPLDFNTSTNSNGSSNYKELKELNSKDIILDIGRKTVDLIENVIISSKTVFWNGPAGFFENKNFASGTVAIAKQIAEKTKSGSLISIVGGGDTLASIKKTNYINKFTHLSTAGGAFLESLEGKELPAIKVLKYK